MFCSPLANRRLLPWVGALVAIAAPVLGSELATLSRQTWREYAPKGKEVDAIFGDYVLRNQHLTVVIAQPLSGRNANMTVRGVGGSVIDLTSRNNANDQLSCFYPAAARYAFTDLQDCELVIDGEARSLRPTDQATGANITLRLASQTRQDGSHVIVSYSLGEEDRHLTITTRYVNDGAKSVEVPLVDSVRADRTFLFGDDKEARLFWFYDEWFRQSYGVTCADRSPRKAGSGRQLLVEYVDADGKAETTLAPGESVELTRRFYARNNVLQTRSYALREAGVKQRQVRLKVQDAAGPVAMAKVSVTLQGQSKPIGVGRGSNFWFALPPGEHQIRIEALGRPDLMYTTPAQGMVEQTLEMQPCGYVVANVVDAAGEPIPCKVIFEGLDSTASPDFGPDSRAVSSGNVLYTANGAVKQELGPGKYELIFSRGPEYDAVFEQVEVKAGEETHVQATLNRVVDSKGWVSTEYHSHSSPSGDNTSDQRGRVLNLLCEHLEFAPCTEHNRIDSYAPHLKQLKAERWMATCTGMELTGGPLPINHQNAFPLIHKPHTQDGGAPVTDIDPVVQIQRLAMWDDGSEKLVQTNHPNLMQIYGDRDTNGKPDGGFRQMLEFMDVVEVHPPEAIFEDLETSKDKYPRGNTIFHWLQLLNQGYRIAGVVNTDAHYNRHGSGWLRNYVASSTDDPSQIDTMEMVRNSTAGRSVMSTGPFLEVVFAAADQTAGPGQDLLAKSAAVMCQVKVQCPNWLDVNRVQLFINGRPSPKHNFTRREHPEMFANGVVKFDQKFEVALKEDSHLVAAAIGEDLQLGRVMGESGKRPPVAVANPVFVDIDGDGFQANGDELDSPLPK